MPDALDPSRADVRGPVLVRIDASRLGIQDVSATAAALHATGRVDAVVLARHGASGADPSVIAGALAAIHPDLDLVIEAGFDGDFAYNLARRVASLQALGSRSPGVLLAAGEPDGVAALHLLWQSWPRDSIVGDRATRTFVDAARLRRVDAAGAHPVAGPLQTPVDQDDLPVVLQRHDPRHPALSVHADVLVVTTDDAADTLGAETRPVFVTTSLATVGAASALGAAGVIVDDRPADVIAWLEASGVPPIARPPGLRRRWGLAAPSLTLSGARPFGDAREAY